MDGAGVGALLESLTPSDRHDRSSLPGPVPAQSADPGILSALAKDDDQLGGAPNEPYARAKNAARTTPSET